MRGRQTRVWESDAGRKMRCGRGKEERETIREKKIEKMSKKLFFIWVNMVFIRSVLKKWHMTELKFKNMPFTSLSNYEWFLSKFEFELWHVT